MGDSAAGWHWKRRNRCRTSAGGGIIQRLVPLQQTGVGARGLELEPGDHSPAECPRCSGALVGRPVKIMTHRRRG